MPPLSIITVCFNEAARIALTCESIVNQTFQDFEWIVIDGGSTDGTLDILQRYASRMNYVVSEPDRGIYHAMNKGIAQAHGVYLLFLNGGDYLYQSDVLEKVFVLRNDLEKDIYYGGLLLEKDGRFEEHFLDIKHPYRLLLKGAFPHQAMFIHRRLFEMYGLYDESLRISGDTEFFLRVFVRSHRRKSHTIEQLPFMISVYENVRGMSSRLAHLRKQENEAIRKRHYPRYYLFMTQEGKRLKKRIIQKIRLLFEKIILRRPTCPK